MRQKGPKLRYNDPMYDGFSATADLTRGVPQGTENMTQTDLYGEDPKEVTSLAVRLFSKDQAEGDLEKYQELKAKYNLLAATGLSIPPEYLERAAKAIKADRDETKSKHKKLRGVLIISAGLALVVAGLIAYLLHQHGASIGVTGQ